MHRNWSSVSRAHGFLRPGIVVEQQLPEAPLPGSVTYLSNFRPMRDRVSKNKVGAEEMVQWGKVLAIRT